MEDCEGLVGGFFTPWTEGSGAAPPAFHAVSELPHTIHWVADAISCRRVVLGDVVVEDAALLVTSLRVVPANASWDAAEESGFILDVFTTHPAVRDALAKRDVEATLASLDRRGPPAVGLLDLPRWTFATPDASVTIQWVRAEPTPAPPETSPRLERSLWAGPEPYRRLDVVDRHAGAGPLDQVQGVLTVAGATALRTRLASDAAPFLASTADAIEWEVAFPPERFRSG